MFQIVLCLRMLEPSRQFVKQGTLETVIFFPLSQLVLLFDFREQFHVVLETTSLTISAKTFLKSREGFRICPQRSLPFTKLTPPFQDLPEEAILRSVVPKFMNFFISRGWIAGSRIELKRSWRSCTFPKKCLKSFDRFGSSDRGALFNT